MGISIKNKILNPTFLRIAGTLTLFIIVYIILFGDLNIVKGNLHDLWIPQLSAYAINTGVSIHTEFHSAFGPIYHYLNGLSLSVINSNLDKLSPADVVFLSSVFFSVILSLLYCLAFYVVKDDHKITKLFHWVFLLALTINFQIRDMSEAADVTQLLWYGSYNNHLWSLLLLQMFVNLYLYTRRAKVPTLFKEDENAQFYIYTLFQFLCLFICFAYKFNFFLSSLALTGCCFFFFTFKRQLFYILGLATLALIGVSFFQLILEYNMLYYLVDVYQAVLSKQAISYKYLVNFFVFLILVFILLFKGRYKNYSLLRELKKFGGFFKTKKNIVLVREVLFCLAIVGALFVGVAGDWQRPVIYYLLFMALYVLMVNYSAFTVKTSKIFLGLLIILNLSSLTYVSIQNYKYSDVKIDAKKKYRPINFMSDDNDIIVKNYTGAFDLLKFLDKYEDNDFIVKLSSLYGPGRRKTGINYFNLEYFEMLQDAVSAIKSVKYKYEDDIVLLEFANPLPILLNTRIPKESLHWVHLGTTMKYEHMHKLLPIFTDAEIIYVPSFTVDGRNQTLLNCIFFQWNYENKRFSLERITAQGLLFIANDDSRKGYYKNDYDYDTTLNDNCSVFINDFVKTSKQE